LEHAALSIKTSEKRELIPCDGTIKLVTKRRWFRWHLLAKNETLLRLKGLSRIEAKLLEKVAKKQAALEAKAAKSALKSVAKKEVKDPTLCLNCGCVALLKTGPRKGEACGQKSSDNNLCKRHTPK
jgi:hypothetical protein